MSTNPFLHALLASGYIGLIVTFFSYMSKFSDDELGIMAPMLFISLFVFSAALMGYFFVYEPLRLLIEGKQREATRFFLTTVFSFALITGALVLTWLLLRTAFY